MAAAVNLRPSLWLCWRLRGVYAEWLVGTEVKNFFMLAVDSWRFRNMKFMRKFFSLKFL